MCVEVGMFRDERDVTKNRRQLFYVKGLSLEYVVKGTFSLSTSRIVTMVEVKLGVYGLCEGEVPET